MNGSRVGIPETLANAAASPAVGFLERPLEFSQGPLLLCAETLNFCSIQEYVSTPTDGLPTNRVGCWKNLFASSTRGTIRGPKSSIPCWNWKKPAAFSL